MKVTIETTADGSPTLYREDLDEHYHSVKGALTESLHVYIDCGWRHVAERYEGEISVFEVGFGSGLNAALTSLAAEQSGIATKYYSVELYPLEEEAVDRIAEVYDEGVRDEIIAVNRAAWGEDVPVNESFTLHKIKDNLLTMTMPENIDVVYFDAFAPEKQPDMWVEEVFQKIFEAMRPGAVLTTYCAKGAIRRMLEGIGFRCERLAGPPGGKREILRAT